MLSGNRLFEKQACFLDLADGSLVFRAQADMTLRENIADNPQTVLHVIESNQAVIEHEHCIVKADFVAQALGKALDEAHHVVAEIADGAGDERRQTREPDRAETLDALAQEGNGIALFPDEALPVFEDTRCISVAEDFFGMRTCKSIAGDLFAAFHAFEKK
jgi:hypothetical protein